MSLYELAFVQIFILPPLQEMQGVLQAPPRDLYRASVGNKGASLASAGMDRGRPEA